MYLFFLLHLVNEFSELDSQESFFLKKEKEIVNKMNNLCLCFLSREPEPLKWQ
jgi:G3E family GTPase